MHRKPAGARAPETLETIETEGDWDVPSESVERLINANATAEVEPLLALARAADMLLAAGMAAQARPLIDRIIAILEHGLTAGEGSAEFVELAPARRSREDA